MLGTDLGRNWERRWPAAGRAAAAAAGQTPACGAAREGGSSSGY
jgi:hypothetical protein